MGRYDHTTAGPITFFTMASWLRDDLTQMEKDVWSIDHYLALLGGEGDFADITGARMKRSEYAFVTDEEALTTALDDVRYLRQIASSFPVAIRTMEMMITKRLEES